VAAVVAAAFLYFGSAALHCTDTLRGAPGDTTAGAIWDSWVMDVQPDLPWPDHTDLVGAPRGERFFPPYRVVSIGWRLPMAIFSKLTNPVCGWNLDLMFGMATTGAAMYALAFHLTHRAGPAAFAAIAYAAAPYVQVKTEGHINGVFLAGFPLLLLGALKLWDRPSWPAGALVAGTLAGLGYVDGYFLLFGPVALAAVVGGRALHHGLTVRTLRPVLTRLAWFAGAGLVALVLLLPVLAVFRSDRQALSDVERSYADLSLYSARPADFLVPHPGGLVGRALPGPEERDYHGSNATEQTLYLGYVVLILAGVGVVRTARRCGDVTALAVTAAVGFVWSMPPHVRLLGVTVPMPSRFVFEFVTFWRVYARFIVVIGAATVALAAVGLARVLDRVPQPRGRTVVVGAAVLVTVVEGLTFVPGRPPVWSYKAAPAVFRWLAEQPGDEPVAEFPLRAPDDDVNGEFFGYQPVHGRAMVNARQDTSRPDDPGDLTRTIVGPGDPMAAPVLRAYGVRLVLVHRELFPAEVRDTAPPGFSLVRSFRYPDIDGDLPYGGIPRWAYLAPMYNVDVYRVLPGPVADVGVAIASGFSYMDIRGWDTARWMVGTGVLDVAPLAAGLREADVSFTVAAFGGPRTLVVRQGGEVLWTGRVETATKVDFRAAVRRPITLSTEPGPVRIQEVVPGSGDPRSVSLYVSQVVARGVRPSGG
jgi:hypothetical protein